ncbi:hypothetical protein ACROYT_G009984 [Oculina patagonica]
MPSSFSFGAASASKPAAAFPGFAPAQPSSSQQTSQPFMFGGSSSNPTSASEETMEADGNNSSGNLFGSPANPAGATFGSTGPSTGFAFGAPSAPSTGGFNFAGAAQASSVPSTFTFGASGGGGAPAFGANSAPAASAPAPGGFNFSAAGAANNSVGSPGMFNFAAGSGTPSGGPLFTAGTPGESSNSAIAGRKIKRAVRRTKR